MAQAGRKSANLNFSATVPAAMSCIAPKHKRNPKGFSTAEQCGSMGQHRRGSDPPQLPHPPWHPISSKGSGMSPGPDLMALPISMGSLEPRAHPSTRTHSLAGPLQTG